MKTFNYINKYLHGEIILESNSDDKIKLALDQAKKDIEYYKKRDLKITNDNQLSEILYHSFRQVPIRKFNTFLDELGLPSLKFKSKKGTDPLFDKKIDSDEEPDKRDNEEEMTSEPDDAAETAKERDDSEKPVKSHKAQSVFKKH